MIAEHWPPSPKLLWIPGMQSGGAEGRMMQASTLATQRQACLALFAICGPSICVMGVHASVCLQAARLLTQLDLFVLH